MNIIVLAGGISPERNISLYGGRSVYNALVEKGHKVTAVDPAFGNNGIFDLNEIEILTEPISKQDVLKFDTKNILECINSEIFDDVDCVFVLLHGQNGEDGLVQSALQLRNIPYTGTGVRGSAISMDKLTSKMLFTYAGVPTPPWSVMHSSDADDLEMVEEVRNELGRSIVVKPNNQGSAVGISIIKEGNLDDISAALIEAGKYSENILLETYIPGREITVAILDNQALPAIEIKPKEGYYNFENKYIKGKTEYECPAQLEPEVEGFVKSIAETAAGVVGINDFGRVDFRITEQGQIFCLEVNTIPGFTETSLYPMASKEEGIEFSDLCDKIVNLGIESFKKGK